jgi:hypothetical protein
MDVPAAGLQVSQPSSLEQYDAAQGRQKLSTWQQGGSQHVKGCGGSSCCTDHMQQYLSTQEYSKHPAPHTQTVAAAMQQCAT